MGKPVLDERKKAGILAILSVGCTRRTAARYVGCDVDTIRRTALRNAQFAEELARAEQQAEIGYLRDIQKAAKKEQYWRAAAWALERKYPEKYALRAPDMVTPEQLERLLCGVTQILIGEVPDLELQQRLRSRLVALLADLHALSGKKDVPHDP